MNRKKIIDLADVNKENALKVLDDSGIADVWKRAGCRVNMVGSLRMGLMASHRDIDLHVYSKGITTESSFRIIAEIAENPRVTEIKCINGLYTEEHCIAWHIYYRDDRDEIWQFDIIHIEEGTQFDGYFERMADRIKEVLTDDLRYIILKLKFETPAGCDYHGVEYYEAVIADGVRTMDEFKDWVISHRQKPPYYWIP